MWRSLKTKGLWEGEIIDRRKDGTLFIKYIKIMLIKNKKGRVKYYFSVQKNVDYIKELEKDKDRYTYHHADTLLPNEKYFIEKLEKAMAEKKERIKVIYCKVMNQLQIEAKYGREYYLEAIVSFYEKIKNISEENTIIAEVDHTSLIIGVTKITKNNRELINQILLSAKKLQVQQQEISLDVQMGVAFCEVDHNYSPQNVLTNAYLALNDVVESKDKIYSVYNTKLEEAINFEIDLQMELKKDLANQKLTLNYQPQIDAKNNEVVGVEVLLRWKNEKLGQISPNIFIDIAEKYGYMEEIDDFIFEQINRDFPSIKDVSPKIKIAINVSQKEFVLNRFYDRLVRNLNNNSQLRDSLIIELTEGKNIENLDLLVTTVNKIKKLGIEISLDDFGTGYNSLKTLSIIDVDEIKIDKSFIDTFPENTMSIVKAIVTLGLTTNKRVIAEGVETKKQVDELLKLECTNIQGYYYSAPIEIANLIEYLKKYIENN